MKYADNFIQYIIKCPQKKTKQLMCGVIFSIIWFSYKIFYYLLCFRPSLQNQNTIRKGKIALSRGENDKLWQGNTEKGKGCFCSINFQGMVGISNLF